MNHELDTKQIRQHLNRSAAQLDQPTVEKLREARMQALSRHHARSTAPAFAWASALAGSGHTAGSHRSHYHWAAIILFAACLFSGITYWQGTQDNDDSDVDIAILTDEMPIDVYVD
ncbi:MAG: DUF3619 family protein [Nitrosomonadales bacterium]|nr:DUF3619 family protein [Nitrosomonadales bacterium]